MSLPKSLSEKIGLDSLKEKIEAKEPKKESEKTETKVAGGSSSKKPKKSKDK